MRWLVSWVDLAVGRGWSRAGRPGWHRALYALAAAVAAAAAVLSLVATFSWRLGDPSVARLVVAWWAGLVLVGVVVVRLLLAGTWVGPSGIRLEWPFARRVVPWTEVAAVRVVPAPWSVGGRVERAVVDTTGGERLTLPGTDSYLHALFGADSPDKVRHALERERRFYATAAPPRPPRSRRRSPGPVVDLREGDGRPVGSPGRP